MADKNKKNTEKDINFKSVLSGILKRVALKILILGVIFVVTIELGEQTNSELLVLIGTIAFFGICFTILQALYIIFSKNKIKAEIEQKNNERTKREKNLKNVGYVKGEVYKVVKKGNSYPLFKLNDERVGTLGASKTTREAAFNEGKLIQAYINKNGKKIYRKVDRKQ